LTLFHINVQREKYIRKKERKSKELRKEKTDSEGLMHTNLLAPGSHVAGQVSSQLTNPPPRKELSSAPVCHYPCKLLLGFCLLYSPQLEVSLLSPYDITIHIFLFLCLGVGLPRC